MSITYEQLPERPAPHVFLTCLEHGGEYSACRADYFWAEPAATVNCQCGQPMTLVREVTTCEEIAPEHAEGGVR